MKNIALALICISTLLSCKKDTKASTPENASTGVISGKTTQYNQYGEQLTTGLNGVTISLDNDNVTAITDDAGNYSLKGVKPGVYTISYSKPGCATYQVQQVNFPGNGTLYKDATLIENPTFQFLSATAVPDTTIPYSNSINVNVKLTPNAKDLWVAIITGSASTIDINGLNYYGPFANKIPANTGSFSFTTRYSSQSDVYAKIYAYSGNETSYYDFKSNTNKLQGFGASLPAIKVK